MTDSFVKKYAEKSQPPNKKILVIDDEQSQLDEHCEAMWLYGYDVIPFLVTGNMTLGAVLNAIYLYKPDGILTDWQMTSYVSGEEIGEMIKMEIEGGELPAIPVILHTRVDNKWLQENAEKWKSDYGFQAVLKKGFYLSIDEVFSGYFDAHPEVKYEQPNTDRYR